VYNKSTVLTEAERRKHGLEGLLPQTVETIERQLEQLRGNIEQTPTNLERCVDLVVVVCADDS